VVFDTIIEDLPDDMYPDRPWGKGNNPKTAVYEYLQKLDSRNGTENSDDIKLEIVNEIDSKLLISVAPSGYLKRVR
jgi:cephalosporin hydroxylase